MIKCIFWIDILEYLFPIRLEKLLILGFFLAPKFYFRRVNIWMKTFYMRILNEVDMCLGIDDIEAEYVLSYSAQDNECRS